MIFQVVMFCEDDPYKFEEHRIRCPSSRWYWYCEHLPKCHGSLLIRLRGVTAEDRFNPRDTEPWTTAKFAIRTMIRHKCHDKHVRTYEGNGIYKEERLTKCYCLAWPLVIRPIQMKGESPNKQRGLRFITIQIIGGEGEILEWYPIGTKLSYRRFAYT